MKDKLFDNKLNNIKPQTWLSFKNVCEQSLDNIRGEDYKQLGESH